jgi:DNA topoisomerase-1
MLPHLEKGETLDAEDILADQNFTQPPARFTEASLVKSWKKEI